MANVKGSEAAVKKAVKDRGGAVKVRTVYPNPNDKTQYAHVYIVRKPGKRGGKTLMGPIQKKGK